MARWVIRVSAVIEDDMEVEADSEEEAIESAHEQWSFVEASQWTERVISRPEDDDDA